MLFIQHITTDESIINFALGSDTQFSDEEVKLLGVLISRGFIRSQKQYLYDLARDQFPFCSFRHGDNYKIKQKVNAQHLIEIEKHIKELRDYLSNTKIVMDTKNGIALLIEYEKEIRRQERRKKDEREYIIDHLHQRSGIYFLKDTYSAIKIGKASQFSNRIVYGYGTAYSQPLAVIAVKFCDEIDYMEGKYHREYRKHRINGNREWFEIPDDEVENIVSQMSDDERICCEQLSRILDRQYPNRQLREIVKELKKEIDDLQILHGAMVAENFLKE